MQNVNKIEQLPVLIMNQPSDKAVFGAKAQPAVWECLWKKSGISKVLSRGFLLI